LDSPSFPKRSRRVLTRSWIRDEVAMACLKCRPRRSSTSRTPPPAVFDRVRARHSVMRHTGAVTFVMPRAGCRTPTPKPLRGSRPGRVWCETCGVRAVGHGRRRVVVRRPLYRRIGRWCGRLGWVGDGAGLIAKAVSSVVPASLEGARALDVACGHGNPRRCSQDCSRNAHRT
jgi:hypothetical protein